MTEHIAGVEVQAPDGTLWHVDHLPADMEVHRFVVEFMVKAFGHRSDAWHLLIVDRAGDSALPRHRILLQDRETLWDAGVRDSAQLEIHPRSEAGGWADPDVMYAIAKVIAGGVAGNAAYDLAKHALRALGNRWSESIADARKGLLSAEDASNLAKSVVCIKFAIYEQENIQIRAAIPITLKVVGSNFKKIRQRPNGRPNRKSRAWECTFDVNEEGMPSSLVVLVKANPPDVEKTWVILDGQ